MGKLSDEGAYRILEKWRIPKVKVSLAKNEKQAMLFAKKTGFPVVLKVSSSGIVHKTEVGGVLVGLKSDSEVRTGFRKIMANVKKKSPKAKVKGILVQEMANGHELIVGAKHDPQFGPVILFGFGGIFVEVFNDVSLRLIPIERKDAREMISEIKGYGVLKGARGQKPIDFKKLEDFLLKVSDMFLKEKKIKELDINPVFVNEKEALAADVRIIV